MKTAYDRTMGRTSEPPKIRYNLYLLKYTCIKKRVRNMKPIIDANMYMKTHTLEHVKARLETWTKI